MRLFNSDFPFFFHSIHACIQPFVLFTIAEAGSGMCRSLAAVDRSDHEPIFEQSQGSRSIDHNRSIDRSEPTIEPLRPLDTKVSPSQWLGEKGVNPRTIGKCAMRWGSF